MHMESNMSSQSPQLKRHFVHAGAGAGKTTALVEKVVELYSHFKKEHRRPPRLIVTTFTRKATQELRERLIVRACAAQDNDLVEYVGNSRSLHISTIHGVLSLFLSQMAHLCDLETGFRITSELEDFQMARMALKTTLSENADFLTWLDDYSFNALLGKLRRFSEVYSQDPLVKPADLPHLEAYHDESLSNLKLRLKSIADATAEWTDKKWSDFGSQLTGFINHWDGQLSSWENRPSKPRADQRSPVAMDLQDEVKDALNEINEEFVDLIATIDHWPHYARNWDDFYQLGLRFHHVLWKAKQSEGLLSMTDLEIFSLRVLRDYPVLGSQFSGGWDFWLIDEYQDTSPTQDKLLRLLRGPSPSFTVGDPQQSIYLFRGARSEIFMQGLAEAESSGAHLERLDINYRSRPELLHFINDFFTSYSDQFKPMKPKAEVESPDSVVATFISGSTETEEDLGIVQHVQRLSQQGVRFDQICLLARTHSHLSEIATVLKAHSIPVQVHSPKGFWRRREILDAMALLKFLVHPHDNLSLITLLRSPAFFVKDQDLADLMKDKPKSLWLVIQKKPLEPIEMLMELLAVRNRIGIVAAFEKGLKISGQMELSCITDSTGRREANLWKLLVRIKKEELKPGFHVLQLLDEMERLLRIDEVSREGDAISAVEPDCVNLMTIHASKGLQFDHVILPRMGTPPQLSTHDIFSHHEEEALYSFPVVLPEEYKSTQSPLDKKLIKEFRRRELLEHERVLYVGLTRAKLGVALTWSMDCVKKHSWAERARLSDAERFSKKSLYRIEILHPPFEINNLQTGSDRENFVPRSQVKKPAAPMSNLVTTANARDDLFANPTTLKLTLARARSSAYGIDMHRALQALRLRPDLAWAKNQFPEHREAISYIWELETPPMRELISTGFVEWGYKHNSRDGIVQGRVDLWGISSSGEYWIVDYKSGRDRGDETAWDQLEAYAQAVGLITKAPRFQLALIYAREKKTLIKSFVIPTDASH